MLEEEFSAMGHRLKAQRELLGWTVRDLACRSGVGITSISFCERGMLTRGPSIEVFLRLVLALRLCPADVLGPLMQATARLLPGG